jgi:hypothetical protein
VSRHHLQIIQDDSGNFRLADFGSKNGTFVNGKRISGEVRLNPNDVIRIGNTTLPWNSYFGRQAKPPKPVYPSPKPEPVSVPAGSSASKTENPYAIWVFLLGLASLGLIVYIVINYLTSFGNQIAGMFGGVENRLKLFPIYLRGYFGVGGQWIPMIAAAALAIIADCIDELIEDGQEDSLSKTGKGMANFALVIAVIFILLAVFAKQIAGAY